MGAKIPAHVCEQRINALPNITFIRWVDGYKNSHSKAICKCAVDGFEWPASVNKLTSKGTGCPVCGGKRAKAVEEVIEQVNSKPNIQFVRWVDGYKNKHSIAICRCAVDGFEWRSSINNLLYSARGCPQCGSTKPLPAEERIEQINAKPNIQFVRWDSGYKNCHSKAVCRCLIDGFEWAATVNELVNKGRGCAQCGGVRKWTSEERIAQINARQGITFVRWHGEYVNSHSKAVCRCDVDGCEWSATISAIVNHKTGCPQCADTGYNPAKSGTLYILRSECGSMVKIGISNDHQRRHVELKRATPFDWSCIELLHGDGEAIADMEKELHSITEQATFSETFDGYTEWRKWEPRLLKWVDRYRTRLARYNKAP